MDITGFFDSALVPFLPGYSLIDALFPRRDDPDGTRTITLSFRAWASLMSNIFIRLNTICIHASEVVHIQDEG